MEKEAQLSDLSFLAEVLEEPEKENVVLEFPERHEDKPDDSTKEYVFKLDLVPGSDNDTIEVLEDEPVEVKEEGSPVPKDEWDWETLGSAKFLDWIKDRFHSVPKHTGVDISGIERAISYLKRLFSEIRAAARKDLKRELDTAKIDNILVEIHKAIERLEDRGNKIESKKFKKNKKSDMQYGLIKEADTTITGKSYISVPYIVSIIARACIDATVSGGRDIEECFEKMATEYKLDKREKLQAVQLIKDMGYPMILDRLNFGKEIKPSVNEVKEYNQQFYA